MKKLSFKIILIALLTISIFTGYQYLKPRYQLKKLGYTQDEISFILNQENDLEDKLIISPYVPGLMDWYPNPHYERYSYYANYLEAYGKDVETVIDTVLDHPDIFVFSSTASRQSFFDNHEAAFILDYYEKHKQDTFIQEVKVDTIVSSQTAPLSISYQPEILEECCLPSTEGQTLYLAKEANEALKLMAEAAKAEGHLLYNNSSYRSYHDQQAIYDELFEDYGKAYVEAYVGKPGHSEHQTGLAIDLSCEAVVEGEALTLYDTTTYDWLIEHCAEYGFILRYPEDKEAITKTTFEPWHFRYVGVTTAKEIMEQGITLEEFKD